MVFRIYTKTGDGGETGLFGGERVQKDDARVEAYGTLDELNASLGWARSTGLGDLDGLVGEIQSLLFELGSELASPAKNQRRIEGTDVARLEKAIDDHEDQLEPLKSFILPGGSPSASALHLARTVCRRAERRVVTLARSGAEVGLAVEFLNRVGDLLFVLGRRANALAGVPDVPWSPRESS